MSWCFSSSQGYGGYEMNLLECHNIWFIGFTPSQSYSGILHSEDAKCIPTAITFTRCRPTRYRAWPSGILCGSMPLRVSESRLPHHSLYSCIVGPSGCETCPFHCNHAIKTIKAEPTKNTHLRLGNADCVKRGCDLRINWIYNFRPHFRLSRWWQRQR